MGFLGFFSFFEMPAGSPSSDEDARAGGSTRSTWTLSTSPSGHDRGRRALNARRRTTRSPRRERASPSPSTTLSPASHTRIAGSARPRPPTRDARRCAIGRRFGRERCAGSISSWLSVETPARARSIANFHSSNQRDTRDTARLGMETTSRDPWERVAFLLRRLQPKCKIARRVADSERRADGSASVTARREPLASQEVTPEGFHARARHNVPARR